ncbi:helix-turn-helix domain-containing protein [Listeria booriae]|uniref:helix-turn-helix domain-containing protein n=1 Tax=Listeria booriae TaxID=1552123 RepID=UPI00162A7DC2|nr:helix-turn-helix transcriptional regulator [Listeria booriae]MBC1893111.1 helix-turn-helix domain-containing protein [Listeria booriae]MBC1974516.1 helix-turn-helix domain-containing protein [Listeria booriae]MBC2031807.1 helix-turn-helix domain-containing protein [Listeria booriae]
MTVLSNRLEKLRKQKGWSKVEVSRRLGMKASSTYSNWEYGNREPDNEMLAKISKLYDVSTDYLLGNSDSPKPDSDNNESFFEDFKNRKEVIDFVSELTDADKEAIEQLKEIWKVIKKK